MDADELRDFDDKEKKTILAAAKAVREYAHLKYNYKVIYDEKKGKPFLFSSSFTDIFLGQNTVGNKQSIAVENNINKIRICFDFLQTNFERCKIV